MIAFKKAQSLIEAMTANIFWGFGFTATIWALQSFTILQILFLRFAIVGVCGLLWTLFHRPSLFVELLPKTFFPSLFLLMEILFQIWGLQYTTATNAGFLTVTYIVIVPILEKVLFSRSIEKSHWLWVTVALLGSLLMAQAYTLSLNPGDLLMLVSALGASLHMLSIDRLGKTEDDLFLANTMQSLWGAVVLLPLVFLSKDSWHLTTSVKPWLGLASLTFGSTLLAFYFQMRAQKTLSPSVSSLLFLIESPIAAAFGLALLDETMTWVQWVGCVFILAAAAGVIRKNLKPAAL